ncbi:MAG: hypothetical protein ABI886_17870, partial [Betaproteobacteria bacterium]
PADFTLGPGRAVDAARIRDAEVSPYCFDLPERTLLCVSTPDIAGSTFFYQAQRRLAQTVVRVPVDGLPDATASPTLIFSIGRCGSTLLYRAFEAAGIRIVSEPDFFTQAAIKGVRTPDDPFLRTAVGRAMQLLPYSAVKLRLECNAAPLLIAGAFPAPRILFILRDPVDWARSHYRQSRNTIGADRWATILKGSLFALAQLVDRHDVKIGYYEDFRSLASGPIDELIAWTGTAASLPDAARRDVAQKNSHEGGAVATNAVDDVAEDPAFRDTFAREWARVRPVDLIARLKLRGL